MPALPNPEPLPPPQDRHRSEGKIASRRCRERPPRRSPGGSGPRPPGRKIGCFPDIRSAPSTIGFAPEDPSAPPIGAIAVPDQHDMAVAGYSHRHPVLDALVRPGKRPVVHHHFRLPPAPVSLAHQIAESLWQAAGAAGMKGSARQHWVMDQLGWDPRTDERQLRRLRQCLQHGLSTPPGSESRP